MQCQRTIWRNACRHHNAYDPAAALRSTFSASTSYRSTSSEPLITLWELNRAGPELHGKDALAGPQQRDEGRGSEFSCKPGQLDGQSRPSTDKHARDAHKAVIRELAASVKPRHPSKERQENLSWKVRMQEINAKATEYYTLAREKRMSKEDIEKIGPELDYEGTVIDPAPSHLPEPLPFPWATQQSDTTAGAGLDPIDDLLSQEIQRFSDYMKPNAAERAAREHVIGDLAAQIREHTPRAGRFRVEGEVFGSETTGLALATSDIDVRVCDPAFEREHALERRRRRSSKGVDDNQFHKLALGPAMDRLARALRRPGSAYICVQHRGGAFPIISAIHEPSGLDVHLVGTGPRRLQRDRTRAALRARPALSPLYTLLRSALATRGLLDTFSGGFGSYGTFVLVLFALARSPSPPASPCPSLGSRLLHILSLFVTLDPSRRGLTLHPRAKTFLVSHPLHTRTRILRFARAAARRGDPWRSAQWLPRSSAARLARVAQPYLLAVQDPADHANDLGLRACAVKHFVATVRAIEREMKGLARKVEGGDEMGKAGRSLLEPLLGRYHEVIVERRKKLEEFGERVLAETRSELRRPGAWRPNEDKMGPRTQLRRTGRAAIGAVPIRYHETDGRNGVAFWTRRLDLSGEENPDGEDER